MPIENIVQTSTASLKPIHSINGHTTFSLNRSTSSQKQTRSLEVKTHETYDANFMVYFEILNQFLFKELDCTAIKSEDGYRVWDYYLQVPSSEDNSSSREFYIARKDSKTNEAIPQEINGIRPLIKISAAPDVPILPVELNSNSKKIKTYTISLVNAYEEEGILYNSLERDLSKMKPGPSIVYIFSPGGVIEELLHDLYTRNT